MDALKLQKYIYSTVATEVWRVDNIPACFKLPKSYHENPFLRKTFLIINNDFKTLNIQSIFGSAVLVYYIGKWSSVKETDDTKGTHATLTVMSKKSDN